MGGGEVGVAQEVEGGGGLAERGWLVGWSETPRRGAEVSGGWGNL